MRVDAVAGARCSVEEHLHAMSLRVGLNGDGILNDMGQGARIRRVLARMRPPVAFGLHCVLRGLAWPASFTHSVLVAADPT